MDSLTESLSDKTVILLAFDQNGKGFLHQLNKKFDDILQPLKPVNNKLCAIVPKLRFTLDGINLVG